MMAAVRLARSSLNEFIVHLIEKARPTPSDAPALERGCGASASVGAPR